MAHYPPPAQRQPPPQLPSNYSQPPPPPNALPIYGQPPPPPQTNFHQPPPKPKFHQPPPHPYYYQPSPQPYYHQPSPAAQPNYGQAPPPPTGVSVQGAPSPGAWSSGLCDCFSNCHNCFITHWCPCITFGQIAEIVDRGSFSCAVSGLLYAMIQYFTGCGCIYAGYYRQKMRRQYMLPAEPCNDYILHFCCDFCALCQEYRELKHRGFDMSLGWHGNIERNPALTVAPFVQAGMSR